MVTQMETGRLRQRRSFRQPYLRSEFNWAFTVDEYATFQSFYQDVLVNGSLSFLLPLEGTLTEVMFLQSPQFKHSDNLYLTTVTVCYVPQ